MQIRTMIWDFFSPKLTPEKIEKLKAELILAIKEGDVDKTKRLIAYPELKQAMIDYKGGGHFYDSCETALYLNKKKSPAILKILLEAGVDPNGGSKSYTGYTERTPLIYYRENAECIKLLLQHGSSRMNSDYNGWTPVMFARHDLARSGVAHFYAGQINKGEDKFENIRLLKYGLP